jgi:hypothetical protein
MSEDVPAMNVPARTRKAIRKHPRLQFAVFGIGLALLAFIIGVIAHARDPQQWQADDWGATALAVLLGSGFLILAQWLQRSADRRSAALADSALRAHIGSMISSSLLSFATGGQAIDVGRHALAAMPLFDIATPRGRTEFLDALERSYGSITLNVFPDNGALPLATCTRLHEDGEQLVRELGEAAGRPSNGDVRARLLEVRDFVGRCMELERWYRDESTAKPAPALDVALLERLYRQELRVYRAWSDPTVAQDDPMVTVTLREVEVTELSRAFSPWYLRRREDTDEYLEVDYSAKVRPDAQPFRSERPLAEYSVPLRHATVLGLGDKLHHNAITKMRDLLDAEARRPTITVFLYRLARGGHTVVLDGNHRLAAALRLARERARVGDPIPRAFVFELQEGTRTPEAHQPPESGAKVPEAQRDKEWTGFNPDVHFIRQAAESGRLG